MADLVVSQSKITRFKIPSRNVRAELDKLFASHDSGIFNQREKTQTAREAARLLANEVERLRKSQ